MARIGENAFRQYRDGQDRLTAPEYMAERELIRLAVNDLDDKIQRTEGIREEFSNTVNEVETVKGEVVQTKQEVETKIGEFTQTLDQTNQELQNKASKEEVNVQLENKASKTEVQEVATQLAEIAAQLTNFPRLANETDDTARIQRAIDFVESNGGGNLYVPKGLYTYSGLIELGESVFLVGAGIGNTIFKMIDNCPKVNDMWTEIGFSSKSGINRCGFRDLEIDGNAPNNRSWSEYGDSRTNCISFDEQGNRVPPKEAYLENLYIHDAVRNCILGSPTEVYYANNITAKNSDGDHLVYAMVKPTCSMQWSNITLSGYARSGLVAGCGLNMQNLSFRDIKVNPTMYDTSFLWEERHYTENLNHPSGFVTRHQSQLNNVKVFIDVTQVIGLFYVNNGMNITNLDIVIPNETDPAYDGTLDIFTCRPVNIDYMQVKNISITNAIKRLKLLAVSYSAKNIKMDNINVKYLNGVVPVAVGSLISVAGSVKLSDSVFSNVRMGLGMGAAVFTFGGSEVKNIVIEDSLFENTNISYLLEFVGTVAKDQFHLKNVQYTVSRNSRVYDVALSDVVETSTGKKSHAKGKLVTSGDGVKTTFTIPHGLLGTPASVTFTRGSSAVKGNIYTTSTSTAITFAFETPPIVGTDNVVIYWEADCSVY